MAINLEKDVTFFGDRSNRKQMILGIPAKAEANKPGVINLQSVSGTTVSDRKLFITSAGNDLRVTTGTTFADSDGSSLVGSGADTALSNLASVQIPDAGDLIPENDNQVDIGTTTVEFKDGWFDGTMTVDLLEGDAANLGRVHGSGANYLKVAASGVATLEGTATIDGVGSGNLLDKSAAEVVTGAWDFTTGGIEIKEDNLKLGFGTAGESDSYILFDGTHLTFYDTNLGGAKTLEDLLTGTQLNPSVNGNLSVTEGKFDWTDAVDEVAGTWSFAGTAASDIDLASSATTGEVIHIIANSLTTGHALDIETDSIGAAGALVYLDITAAGHNATGNFIECYDGAADAFEVGKYGAMVIAGTAKGTDILTATAGDITLTSGDCTLTDGDYVVTEGKITVSTVTDETSFIKRNKTGATSALLELETTHTGDTGTVLLIDQLGTGNQTAIDLNVAGDLPAIDIDASAARTGDVIDISMTNQEAQQALNISGNITSAAGEGVIHIDLGTGVLDATGNALLIEGSGNHAALSHMVELNYDTGTIAGATDGMILGIYDTSTAVATSYAVEIDSTNNEALHVDAGEVVVDEFVKASPATATGGLVTRYDGSQDLTATPTNTEFDTAFGATALSYAGFIGVAKDSGGTPVYIVVSDGTDWWYTAGLTKAL